MTAALAAPARRPTGRFEQLRPGLTATAVRADRLLSRFALPLLALVAVPLMVVDYDGQVHQAGTFGTNGDGGYFAGKGSVLLSSHALDLYSDRTLQSGPWQLLAWRALAVLGGQQGSILAGCVAATVCAFAVYGTARLLLRGARYRELLSCEVALLLLVWGAIPEAYDFGHLAEVAIPLLWLLAARSAQRGEAVAAGALLGVTAGIETWGVLGAAVLLLVPGLRRRLVGAAVAAGVVGATYLPFVVTGHFRMLAMQWRVTDQTLVHLAIPVGSPFTYQMRLVQVLAAVGVGAVLAWRTRTSTASIWLAIAPVGVRLLLDAQIYDYYVIPLRIAGAVGIAMALAQRRWAAAAVLLVGTCIVFTNELLTSWLPVLLFVVLATGVACWPFRGRTALRQTGDPIGLRAQDPAGATENH